ncbi:MAG: peptidase inhibitor family I36 protein [Desmonostoc vinosum HA7617-LM4]|nr:peptidase inhibitor family I36 protein [Desmonostoc vinosum HA7617-LM4]
MKPLLALALTAGTILSQLTIPNVAKAQTVPDCPPDSVCVWRERDFNGERLVVTPVSTTLSGVLTRCNFISGLSQNVTFSVELARSIRNNTVCIIKLYIQKSPGGNQNVSQINPNTQNSDSGEFRSIR